MARHAEGGQRVSYTIVIPSCTESNLRACVASIRAAGETGRIIAAWDRSRGNPDLPPWEPDTQIRDVESPFVFAANVNIGIAGAGSDDVIILNDDTRLVTRKGFDKLSCMAKRMDGYGIISAGITAAVGNLEQLTFENAPPSLVETSHHTLVFVAVYIRRAVLAQLEKERPPFPPHVGQWLDERFVGYGYDDDDMCERVRQHGYRLGIFHGCVVEHGVLPSTYRAHASAAAADLMPNRQRFIEKWGFPPGQRP